jgi:hypothetical protein
MWKECPRGDVTGQWVAFYVTMNTRGFIVMTRPTYEKLGAPKAFQLFFDATNNRIGMKPSALAGRNAYPVGPSGPHGGKMVRAFRLMKEFGIDLPETIRFEDAEVDDEGILILDLRTAKVSPKSLGQKQRKK